MGVGAEGGGGLPKETKFLPLKSDSITWSHSDIISNVLNIPNIRLDIRLPRFPSSETFLPKIPLMKSRQRWISLGAGSCGSKLASNCNFKSKPRGCTWSQLFKLLESLEQHYCSLQGQRYGAEVAAGRLRLALGGYRRA